MKHKFSSSRNYSLFGFTLMKLSIVLVVLALLAAGVAGGQALIATAEIDGAL